MLGLKVTALDGTRISIARATGRHFAKFLNLLTLLIGFFMIGWTRRKQGLHDMIAGTRVYKKQHARPRATGRWQTIRTEAADQAPP